MSDYDWMEEARGFAAQCWCDEETKTIEMDTRLAEAVARRIAGWMQTAAQHARNEEYYLGLLEQCAANLGDLKDQAFIADDGSISEDVLRAKVPELVGRLRDTCALQATP